ncbi:hypothetical protein [Pediococcus pentosaceus]|uniref:hypothetical protein n=1 Tax=Pediococcus pentosaceus TaxID=1255 RepID=UPI00237F3E84|nr:hypothetical protein [Pediococcus pentosaceus]MDE3750994.1 hypothetical protein [Pediococcus pentosaceus]
MSLDSITVIIGFVTAIITLINTVTTSKQSKKDAYIATNNTQSNIAYLNQNNINGTLNINQTIHKDDSESKTKKTWKTRLKQTEKLANFEIILVLIPIGYALIPFFTKSTEGITVSEVLIKTIPSSIATLSIINFGSLILFFMLKVFYTFNPDDSGPTNLLHHLSRIIWPISIIASFFLSYMLLNKLIASISYSPILLIIILYIDILGTKTFMDIVFSNTMYKVFNIRNLIIHILFWFINIGIPLLFVLNLNITK